MNRQTRWIVQSVLGLGLVLTLALGQPAQAQQRPSAGMMLDMTQADYLHRDMPIIAQELDLDDSQRMILDSLYEDYRRSFDEGWMDVQQSMAQSIEDRGEDLQPEEALDLVLKPLENWQEKKQQMKQRFEGDVQVILNEEQMERWPALERRLRRDKTLHLGRLSGESVDLFTVIRQQRLSPRHEQTIEPLLEQYSIELDRAIRERNDLLQQQQVDLMRTIRETGAQPENRVRNAEREVQTRIAVRDVNDRYIDEIANALPHEPGARFRESAIETAYQRAYRPVTAQRVFERALNLETVEDEVRESIRDLKAILSTELEHINRRIHTATRNHEPRALVHEARMVEARMQGERIERLEDPTHELVRAREQQSEYYVMLLRDLLTEDEFASIPGTQRWRPRAERAERRPAGIGDAEERRRARDARRERAREQRDAESRDRDSGRLSPR